MRRLVGSCLLACAACTWGGRDSGLSYACPDERCPAGQVCRAGLCEPTAEGDGGLTSSWCSEPARFSAEFETDLDPGTWAVTNELGAVAHAVGGQLAIEYQAQDAQAEATMLDHVDHGNAAVTVEVTAPSDLSSHFIRMRLFDDPATEPLLFAVDTFDISATVDSDQDVPQVLRTDSYDPQKHRFWRIARTADQVCFSTSRDGDVFDEFACGSSFGVRTSLRAGLAAGNYAGTDAQTVRFDHLIWCTPAL